MAISLSAHTIGQLCELSLRGKKGVCITLNRKAGIKTRQVRGVRSWPISRVLSRTVIHLGRTSPRASSDLPGNTRGPRAAARSRMLPYLVLLRVGFTLPLVLPPARCALTAPFHPYRRGQGPNRRYLFCGTFRGLTSPRRYLAPCPMEPGLSSPSAWKERLSGQLLSALS
jgi:hypothetical protein